MLLPGHPGGVNWYEQCFSTVAENCDLEQQADKLQGSFWAHLGYENLKVITWIN